MKALILTAAPKAVVFTRWMLGGMEDADSWPGELVSEDDGGKVHGYVITRRRTRPTPKGNNKARLFEYWIFGMHYLLPGTDLVNSELKLFSPELDLISNAFDLAGTDDLGARVIDSVDFSIDSDRFADEILHTNLGVLNLEPCRL